MTAEPSPWAEISTPDQDYNVRKVKDSASPLYWGKDSGGRPLFVMELASDQASLYMQHHVKIRGIDSDLRGLVQQPELQRLVLALAREADQEFFQMICAGIIERVDQIDDSAAKLQVAFEYLQRWKAFMASERKRILSPAEKAGLFGELLFLRKLLEKGIPEDEAVASWLGPDGNHQDFLFRGAAIEIKALTGYERSAVRISSEDQLETTCEHLFLYIYLLKSSAGAESALTLNALAQQIDSQLENEAVRLAFQTALAKRDYVEISEYSRPTYSVQKELSYSVAPGFPRLVRSQLPPGVVKIAYDVQLEHIEPFRCDTDTVLGES